MKTLKEYRFKNNPKEKLFVDVFLKDHANGDDMDFIVFGQTEGIGFSPNDRLTEREESIVISTIQWLGSPVGQGFLNQVNER